MKEIFDKLSTEYGTDFRKLAYAFRSVKNAGIRQQVISVWEYGGEPSPRTLVYHALTRENPTCPYGNIRRVESFSDGYICKKDCQCSIDKQQQTMMKKYGVFHAMQSEEIANRAKQTLCKNHGVDSLHLAGLERRTKTNLDRYGVEFPLSSTDIREKSKETIEQKYGVSSVANIPGAREKAKNTLMENWGVDNYFKSEQYLELKQSMIEEQRKELYGENYAVLNDKEQLSELLRKMSRKAVANHVGCSLSLIDKQIRELGLEEFQKSSSYYETLLENLLIRCGVEFVKNTRKIISPKELDFYIPAHNLAIEFNGLRWHGELSGKNKWYHYNKMHACREQGIRLIQIFQDEYDNNPHVVEDLIAKALGFVSTKIYAKHTEVKKVDNQIAKEFCESYHLQGWVPGVKSYGLFHDDFLVSVMTFSTTRGKTELVRFVNRSGTSVVGGASKLLKFFIEQEQPTELFTYSDLRWFTGNLYKSLGFTATRETSPGYFYTRGTERYHRSKFTKKSLVKQGYDEQKTERQIMIENGYDIIWDCGHTVWEMTGMKQ